MGINQAVLAKEENKVAYCRTFLQLPFLQDSLKAKCSFRWKLRLNGTALGEAEQRAGTSKLDLVLPLTSPAGFAPRPVWGPRCRRLGAQVNVTRRRIRLAH